MSDSVLTRRPGEPRPGRSRTAAIEAGRARLLTLAAGAVAAGLVGCSTSYVVHALQPAPVGPLGVAPVIDVPSSPGGPVPTGRVRASFVLPAPGGVAPIRSSVAGAPPRLAPSLVALQVALTRSSGPDHVANPSARPAPAGLPVMLSMALTDLAPRLTSGGSDSASSSWAPEVEGKRGHGRRPDSERAHPLAARHARATTTTTRSATGHPSAEATPSRNTAADDDASPDGTASPGDPRSYGDPSETRQPQQARGRDHDPQHPADRDGRPSAH